MNLGKLLILTALATGFILGSFADSAEARRRTRRRGTWSGSSNGIFLNLERDYEILNATSIYNSTPKNIAGTKFFGGFDGFPSFDTLFVNNLELNLDASARNSLGNIDSLTADIAQEITQLQSQGAIYGQDYFLFDNAVTDFSSELTFGGSVEESFATPNPNLPSDSSNNNFFTTQGQNVIDTENRFFGFDLVNAIAPSINIDLETTTILVSKLKLDDELIIGQQDDSKAPGAFYRTDDLPDFCRRRFFPNACDDLGFNKNNGVSFPLQNGGSGQLFNPEYVTETDGQLLFKYRITIDLGGDADRYFLFVPAFTAPDANGNFNELNFSGSPSLLDFLSFPDSKSGGCARRFGNSPDNAICLGGVLDLGSDNNIEHKIIQQIDLLDDLTTANLENPNLVLEDTQILRYRRTQLIRETANSNNEDIFNLRPYGVFSPPIELVITEEEIAAVPEPNYVVTLLSFGLLGIGIISKTKPRS